MHQLLKTPLGQIEFSIKGTGDPIVLLHGGHSNCQETLFQKGYDLNKFQLITPSRPGYGQTPIGNKQQPKAAAALMLSLLKELEIQEFIVVGISAGGLTAIQLAADYPNRVQKLVLISAVSRKWFRPTDAMYQRGKKMFSPKREKWSWLLFRFFFRLFPMLMAKVLFKELSTSVDVVISNNELEEVREMTFKQRSREGFVADLDQYLEMGVIAQVKCPTLILHSENDNAVDIQMAHFAHKEIQGSELKTYHNKWGHLLWVGLDSQQPIRDVACFLSE